MSGAGVLRSGVLSDVEGVVSLVGSDPILASLTALVAVALVLGLWVVSRRLRRSGGKRLRWYIADADSVSVLMHPNPDPDAMSCALAVGALADAVDTPARLQYPGQIRHQENRAFETVLDLDFDRIESASELDGDEVVLVDHNTPRGFTGADGVEPAIVVDHHPGNGTGQKYTDIRTDTGACATIFAEYFDDVGWTPAGPDEVESADGTLPPWLSTGLMYGIQSDTNHLTKGCSAADFTAASYLFPGVDEDRLDRIANPEMDADVLDAKATAIREREVRNAFAVSDLGSVSNVDAIPQAADELLRLEGVTAVVVFGEADGTLHLSGRSRDDRVHMGKTLRSAVDSIPMADAGGHARMGGGQLSIDHMAGIGPSDGLSREQFVDRLFEAMGGEL